jgi:hypothetical protein
MTNPAPQPPLTDEIRVQWYDPDMGHAYWVEVIRQLQDYEVDRETADGQGPFYEVEVDYGQGIDTDVICAIERKVVPGHSLTYLPYELPSYQAQPLTLQQWLKLADLCRRYKVPFDPSDYLVHSMESSMTKGYAEGWVGGRFGSGVDGSRTTLYVGVAPDGRSHS